MTGMLASVTNFEEALVALSANVDIIDLKQPVFGALGALETSEVKYIVKGIAGRLPVSATVGDLPMQPNLIYQAVTAMAKTGVDYIKIGFFPGGDWQGTLDILTQLPKTTPLIAVLFADTQPDFAVIPTIKEAGFAGVMLDTVNKSHGSLTEVMAKTDLARFVQMAKDRQLMSGLAGSLRMEDIIDLMLLSPDYLGFRGALCLDQDRTAQLNKWAIVQIKQTIDRCAKYQPSLPAANIINNNERRIVIADDNEINRLILANLLEMNGYKVDAAENGEVALQLISEHSYKIALIDLSMPVMSGLEMIKILRNRHNSLKVAAISTFADIKQKTEALAAGFDYCLTKPVSEDQLLALLNLK